MHPTARVVAGIAVIQAWKWQKVRFEVAVRRLVLREGEEWGRVGDHCGGWGDEPDLIWDVCIRTHIL